MEEHNEETEEDVATEILLKTGLLAVVGDETDSTTSSGEEPPISSDHEG